LSTSPKIAKLKDIKVAIFYDWLNNWGGAERVLLDLLTLYPQADIYTLVHDSNKTKWLPLHHKIYTSFLNKLPFSRSNPIFYTPLYHLAIEQFNFSTYDLVISTTTTVGHGLITPPQAFFVCYFHNLNRYVYYTPTIYKILTPFLSVYKIIDKLFIRRPDAYFCNSKTVASRLKKHYSINAQVISPGINPSLFPPSIYPIQSRQHFLVVGRQVPHKKIDVVIKCFQKLPQQKLIIAGSGRSHRQLQDLAKKYPNITFIDQPSDSQLLDLYQQAKALICPQFEDFGLTPIEAQSCGTPVIAYGRGGNLETTTSKTSIYFYHQTPKSLTKAINKYLLKPPSPQSCVIQSQRFTQSSFMLNFSDHLQKLWTKKATTIS
jgi:glycosyltransferase involved in cell wall biosynthesis